jgi:hypothetical protein
MTDPTLPPAIEQAIDALIAAAHRKAVVTHEWERGQEVYSVVSAYGDAEWSARLDLVAAIAAALRAHEAVVDAAREVLDAAPHSAWPDRARTEIGFLHDALAELDAGNSAPPSAGEGERE